MIIFLTLSFTSYGDNRKFTLVIDPGHGGKDVGARGVFSMEKNINLNVALAFGRYVERNCPDVKVIYTRKTDVFLTLHERARIANRNKADLFISVHTNALPGGRIARGLETYTLGMHRAKDNLDVAKRENSVILVEKDYKQHYEGFDPNSAESYIMFEFIQDRNMAKSVDLAKMVQQSVCYTANRPDKGVKQAGFLVLRETSMPSCLIELGFITTPEEEQFLNTSKGIDNMGRGIYQAFVRYKNKYSDNVVIPYVAEKEPYLNVPNVVPQNPVAQPGESIKEERNRQRAERAEQEQPLEPRVIPTESVRDDRKVETDTNEPVIFKVQIVACSRSLRPGSQQFKGHDNVECYTENGMKKYTIGSSADYDEINRLRNSLLTDFPQAFIVAFKGGKRVDVYEAINNFKANKTR